MTVQTKNIPARKGIAFEVKCGERVRLINTYGSQVLDTWALDAGNVDDFMSMEHSRSAISRIFPKVGDTLVSHTFRPMLTLLEDTTPGIHDTLMCCCSKQTYERLGCKEPHDNCKDNFHSALKSVGKSLPVTPGPLNLFMNFPVSAEGRITREPPVSRAGDSVTFRAEMDLLIVISACPQDITPINGADCIPTDAAYEILGPQ